MPTALLILLSFLLPEAAKATWSRAVNVEIAEGTKRAFVFHRDGNILLARECPNVRMPKKPQLLDNQPADALCLAREPDIRLPLDAFKDALKQIFIVRGPPNLAAPRLKSFTDDVRHLKIPEKLQQEEDQKEVLRLLAIKEAIDGIGSEPTEKERPAFKLQEKLAAIAEGRLDKIAADGDNPTRSRDILGDMWAYSLIQQFDARQKECGPIAAAFGPYTSNCATIPKAKEAWYQGAAWELVARKWEANGRFYEVWRDTRSGLLWSERLDSWYTHEEALSVESPAGAGREKACASAEGKRASAGLPYNFRLPSSYEYMKAFGNAIDKARPRYGFRFWSSYAEGDIAGLPEDSPTEYVEFRNRQASVRCVYKEK
ncbi:MAG: hypothetical protein EOP11_08775 [Proteobacteria bacterium]|nr:MAG: hypothetical protein EOP11_08775 [Pseudomonadota bacterium]